MKRFRILVAFFLCLLPIAAQAQEDLVRWKHTESVEDGITSILFEASIKSGWHMYDLGPYDGGPNPTVFTFEGSEGVELVGDVEYVTEPEKAYDEIFGMEIGYFNGSAKFLQKAIIPEGSSLNVNVEWMCCNSTSCTPPQDEDFVIGDGAAVAPAVPTAAKGSSRAIWLLILQAILWGFAALATPCVFPMIPMTVSFFLKGSENKAVGRFRAFMYGLFIVLLYTVPIGLIIVITWLIGGNSVTADIFNWLATHWLPNIVFFIVFMVFAASFLGAFEIVLPSRLVNSSDRKSDGKGLGGVFFMALTLVLVSFSCTGPIVGTVLIQSTSGEFWAPILTMLAFSVAFALPFTLFALFPSWLKKLPKSGGWLNTVKVTLGFVELALGFKFLSTADQTYQWGILNREIYLVIWIVCFSLLFLFLIGRLKLGHDDSEQKFTAGKAVLAIATSSFVIWLLPGLWGAPLKAISGYLPPIETQHIFLGRYKKQPVTYDLSFPKKVKYGDSGLKLPHDLQGFFDLYEAEEYAEKVGKPLFIDFTGLGCMNCREMEARVLSDPEILKMLREDYVFVALYGDDKKNKVPEEDWITTDRGKVLKTLGKINSYKVLKEFGVNAQPYYILKGHGKLLAEPRSYNLDIEAFREFLKEGLRNY